MMGLGNGAGFGLQAEGLGWPSCELQDGRSLYDVIESMVPLKRA